jgi:hypothetical protein
MGRVSLYTHRAATRQLERSDEAMTRDDQKYNGWTNYATWRINLELADDTVESWSQDIPRYQDAYATVSDLADAIQQSCEEAVTNYGALEGLAVDYAMAFMDDVNWYEIAEHAAENYPAMIVADEDDDADTN